MKNMNMDSSFKKKFDEYELLFTPVLLIISVILIYTFIPQFIYLENYFIIFIIPSFLGNFLGVILTFVLDKYWKKVSSDSIADFIRLPTLILILFASLNVLLMQYDAYLSFTLLGVGIGALSSLVCATSLLTYYRSYYLPRKNKLED